MKPIMIGIRVDGSAQVGMGHLMRCLTIARALAQKGAQIIFIAGNQDSLTLLEEQGFPCALLEGQYATMEEELPELCELLENAGVNLLVVDSYGATHAYLEKLGHVTRVVYMEDMGDMRLPVAGLINYNIYGDMLPYEREYPEETLLLLGSKYAPVREEFISTPHELREDATRVLVTMGGSDSLNIAGQLGRALLRRLPEKVEITLVCGRFSPHLAAVKALEEENGRVHVLTDVRDMWCVMSRADVAISAAGSTMYELCTMGVPTVCCYYAENQRRMAEEFGRRTSMINAGDFSREPEKVLERMTDACEKLVQDYVGRVLLSAQMRQVSDGRGADRIAERLMYFAQNQ